MQQEAELAVPADEPEVAIEHRDPLRHLIERGLEEVAVVLDRGRGLVEKLEGALGRGVASLQQQR